MTAVYASLRSQASNISFAAVSGGSLTGSGTLYLSAQLRSRGGLNLHSTPVAISYSAGQRISVTIAPAVVSTAETGSAHEVVISGSATNSVESMVRLASFNLLQSDQITQVALPQTFYLSQPAHLALAATVASPAALPTGASLINGMVRQITSLSATYYKYDATATVGAIAASPGFWVLYTPWTGEPNGFTTYFGTSTDSVGGCDFPLKSVGPDAIALPPYNPALGASTPLRLAIGNGLTEDGGNTIEALSPIGMIVEANGVNLSAAFSGAIDVTYLGLARKLNGTLDTSSNAVGVNKTVSLFASNANNLENAQGNPTLSSFATTNLVFPQAVPRGYFALFSVRFNTRANQIAQFFNGLDTTIYFDAVGDVGEYSALAEAIGDAVLKYADLSPDGFLRILPASNSVVSQPGLGVFQGYIARRSGTRSATLAVADTAGQKVAIAGATNGQIIIRQPGEALSSVEALRALVSTAPGTATAGALSSAVSVGAGGTIDIVLTYPTTIRANYPDVIAGTIAPFNVPRLKVYLKVNNVITEQSALITCLPGGGTQSVTITTNSGSVVGALPTNADTSFSLFDSPSSDLTAGSGGSLSAGSYQVAFACHFPTANTQASAISHQVSAGCVPEILSDLATAIGGAKGYTSVAVPGFTQPAVGASVSIPVLVTDFFAVSQPLFVQTSGAYTIASKSSNTLTATKLADASGTFTAVGGTVAAGSLVVPSGSAGATGAPGSLNGLRYTFSALTTPTPASGTIRKNNSTTASVTALYLSESDRLDASVASILDTLTPGSILILASDADQSVYHYFNFVSQTDNGSDRTLTVTYLTGTGALIAAANVSLGIVLKGATGAGGAAATIAVGTTSTLTAGSNATVSNVGSSSASVLNFGIPAGATGAAATIAVGSTSTLASGSSATVTNTGTSNAAILDFGIPTGVAGAAATIAVGTVTTGTAGSSATVTNAGSSSAAVFNFTIPKGEDGTGAGTVTSFSAGDFSPLFTTTEATPTTTPVLSFAAVNQNPNLFYASPASGSAAAPTFRAIVAADLPDLVENAQTGTSYTLVLSDRGRLISMSNAAANTITVPPDSAVAFPTGSQIIVEWNGVGQTTVAPGTSVTIRSSGSRLKLAQRYAWATLIKRGTNLWSLVGEIAA